MLCESILSATFILGSMHLDPPPDTEYNNVNPGIILKCKTGVVFGGYRNSYRKPTFLAGYHFSTKGDFRVGVLPSACTGYKHYVCIAGTAEYEHVILSFVPKIVKDQHAAVITLGIRYDF